jgi:hypothetical protein
VRYSSTTSSPAVEPVFFTVASTVTGSSAFTVSGSFRLE